MWTRCWPRCTTDDHDRDPATGTVGAAADRRRARAGARHSHDLQGPRAAGIVAPAAAVVPGPAPSRRDRVRHAVRVAADRPAGPGGAEPRADRAHRTPRDPAHPLRHGVRRTHTGDRPARPGEPARGRADRRGRARGTLRAALHHPVRPRRRAPARWLLGGSAPTTTCFSSPCTTSPSTGSPPPSWPGSSPCSMPAGRPAARRAVRGLRRVATRAGAPTRVSPTGGASSPT